ncbi:hypothetical protein P296_08155 [Salmonella enterica subsp. arizonae serovar 18:z4,z23:- str. CVM N26624]|uniref:Uncharacterized protein n=1 Tax=Salmonella enterica subsp. arizonae serovar 18:z4,z23:- str. CVM N26626 TaxID=1395119 RepID=A0A3S5YGU4_SALER|nr:hypothetical protein N898_13615 [Salmonella enterica subsp. arizonae serovar 62:z36:- str. RKS2983]OLV93465.1 hypothetical protein P297_06240 [Salmonella enterica subsp. arizonae serovar 18:z4,z23:- str. CVM N26625]OLV96213.1 hypothetical protein P298_02265 [Salmonella enterica subsp. arizonae serovar 18:z4,z23:- str. CVM N26626]OLW03452.1 hypothetical protein P296_08155 [Salmonella enterica subsp. arizonae serovar 18:z4,z23:- str. CVM N26624]OLW13028.1 hypothetical protein P293_14105 [Salmo
MQHFDITHFGVTTIFLFHMRLKLFEKKAFNRKRKYRWLIL